MSYKLYFADSAYKEFEKVEKAAIKANKSRLKTKKTKSSKQEGLFKQIRKTIQLLSTNPKHPSLNTHEYSTLTNPLNPKHKVFEAYAQNKTPGAYRVFWCYGPKKKEITIIAITPHP